MAAYSSRLWTHCQQCRKWHARHSMDQNCTTSGHPSFLSSLFFSFSRKILFARFCKFLASSEKHFHFLFEKVPFSQMSIFEIPPPKERFHRPLTNTLSKYPFQLDFSFFSAFSLSHTFFSICVNWIRHFCNDNNFNK